MIRYWLVSFAFASMLMIASTPASEAEKQEQVRLKPADRKKIDTIFTPWSNSGSPGCALGVLRDGKFLYKRGYGMADVEQSIPIAPNTVFHVASIAKQFTAFSVHLLAREGKLSLDDDVRKYVPELNDFGKTVTIRNLLQHTSGLRDQWHLLRMAGWRLEDVITEQDVLKLVARQKELNFAPGEEFLYSNTGYTLLGLVVKRASGEKLTAFADQRVFAPLKMHNTQYREDYGTLIKNRAQSYLRGANGSYRYVALSFSTIGPSGLLTTIEDLARWDENFYTFEVGGAELAAAMQVEGKVNGQGTTYASGLVLREYRGVPTVEHFGEDAGFRTEIMRFPSLHFTVITLCNAGDADPAGLAHEVADIVVGDRLEPIPAKAAEKDTAKQLEVKIDASILDTYVGTYEIGPAMLLKVARNDDQLTGQLTGQPSYPVFASSETSFFAKAVNAQLTFERQVGDAKVTGLFLRQNGRELRGKRVERPVPTAEQLQAYAGTYYSEELDTLYRISLRDGKLFIQNPRGESEMMPATPGVFVASFPFGTLKYICSNSGSCNCFTGTTGRVRNLRFDRVNLTPIESAR